MGNLSLRLPDELHQAAVAAARTDERSLNSWILRAIREQLARQAIVKSGDGRPARRRVVR